MKVQRKTIERIPSYTINPQNIALYDYIHTDNARRYQFQSDNKHVKAGLSNHQAKRIKKAIDWLYYCSRKKHVYFKATNKRFYFKLNFITLTLSRKQSHDDKVILKKIFEPFIRVCRNKFKGFLYVWKAEVQDNGNLHFHVNTNVYIHHSWLREEWNYWQSKLDYVDENQIPFVNSTDVCPVKNSKELGSYMSKYLAKGDRYKKPLLKFHEANKAKFANEKILCFLPCSYFQNLKRKINIKLWDCSNALKNISFSSIGFGQKENEALNEIYGQNRIYKSDYFEVICNVDYTKFPNNYLTGLVTKACAKVMGIESLAVTQIALI